MVVVNLMDVMGDNAKKEAIVEGMESEEEEEEEGEEEGPEYDEHVWLSVKNAEIISERRACRLPGAAQGRAGSTSCFERKQGRDPADPTTHWGNWRMPLSSRGRARCPTPPHPSIRGPITEEGGDKRESCSW